jgi:hypothetical protein
MKSFVVLAVAGALLGLAGVGTYTYGPDALALADSFFCCGGGTTGCSPCAVDCCTESVSSEGTCPLGDPECTECPFAPKDSAAAPSCCSESKAAVTAPPGND